MHQKITLLANSLPLLVEQIVEHIKKGWELDPELPADMNYFKYVCGMMRDVTQEQLEIESKPTRADNCAKARAAKAQKAKENK